MSEATEHGISTYLPEKKRQGARSACPAAATALPSSI